MRKMALIGRLPGWQLILIRSHCIYSQTFKTLSRLLTYLPTILGQRRYLRSNSPYKIRGKPQSLALLRQELFGCNFGNWISSTSAQVSQTFPFSWDVVPVDQMLLAPPLQSASSLSLWPITTPTSFAAPAPSWTRPVNIYDSPRYLALITSPLTSAPEEHALPTLPSQIGSFCVSQALQRSY